ncbi:cell division protein FtsQ/DivIB [Salana multivorans]
MRAAPSHAGSSPPGKLRGADLVIPAEELEDFDGRDVDGEGLDDDDYDYDEQEWDELDETGRRELTGRGEPVPGARVSQLDDRLAERRRSSRRVLWVRIGSAVGAAAVLAVAIWLVGFSSVLGLRADQVTIEGEGPYLDRDAALAEVLPHVDTPLARLDTASIAEAIVQAPGVKEAEVARSWPNGVTVTLVPREPVAVADAGGEQVDLVGADGVVVATTAADAVPEGLPLLTVDMSQDGAQETVLAVLSVLDELPPELREQVRDAGAASREAMSSACTPVARSCGGVRLRASSRPRCCSPCCRCRRSATT